MVQDTTNPIFMNVCSWWHPCVLSRCNCCSKYKLTQLGLSILPTTLECNHIKSPLKSRLQCDKDDAYLILMQGHMFFRNYRSYHVLSLSLFLVCQIHKVQFYLHYIILLRIFCLICGKNAWVLWQGSRLKTNFLFLGCTYVGSAVFFVLEALWYA